MYCPECDKGHRNGEEFCTDCGTELVTSLKFYMMCEFGDY
jgi:predicted amidophosphoribosyltransferase